MLPTPWSVGVKRFSPDGVEDAHGNSSDAYAEPLPLPCYFIAPGAMDEPANANRDLSVVEFTIGAPENPNLPAERDRVVLEGVEYAVNGKPKDWNRGPFGYRPGVTFELRKVEG